MKVQLDEKLLAQTRWPTRHDGLTFDESVAINLLWRKQVRIPILAKVFQCSKNTIYYNCLTGEAPSYQVRGRAREVNALVDRMGEDKAWDRYVTEEMVRAVDAANLEFVQT